MLAVRSLVALAACASIASALFAEIPLPDHTLFGHITTTGGTPIASGQLKVRIRRGAVVVLEATGRFIDAEGGPWYAVDIPLETAIGAPGPSGIGAHEGDVIEALILNGSSVAPLSPLPVLRAGAASRVDATADQIGLVHFRGDCSPDRIINLTDAVRVLNFLFLSPVPPPCLESCDSDGSGGLNITDAVYTLGFLFLGGPAPPEPGPACGLDPTPSTLGCVESSCS